MQPPARCAANADQADRDGDGVGDVIDEVVLPGRHEDCAKGEWTDFYDHAARFRNQGGCVSFVASGRSRVAL